MIKIIVLLFVHDPAWTGNNGGYINTIDVRRSLDLLTLLEAFTKPDSANDEGIFKCPVKHKN